MKKAVFIFLIFFLFVLNSYSNQDSLRFTAVKTSVPPRIDGTLDDACWKLAVPLTGFVQYDPFQGKPPKFQTFVYVLYNDEAIFFGAKMYDHSPDSVLRQLGNRDDDLNADDIVFQFDPFGNNQDAYYFRVTASNVQSDWRQKDESYNAVWQSQTHISDEGWSVEVKIPYSSLRLPAVTEHRWAFQVTRNIRRTREFSKLSPETKGVDNNMIFWGILEGLSDIQPPVRLSLTPYLSVFAEINASSSQQSEKFSITPIGGLDLKYGINESYTLDLTLLPDFSQVRSDDIIKNLSAFEVNFSEQRPFFLESMDLFKLGNLFYSRRIGRLPGLYYATEHDLEENEIMISNPGSVSLINAFKITGQTKRGLSTGILNAITDRTFAEIMNADGITRKVETEPMSNYNILVFRQALKNNSSVYLINTNLLREGRHPTANVTGAGLKLYTPSNRFALTLNGSSNSRFIKLNETGLNSAGYAWNGMIAKVRGNLQYHYYYQMKNKRYDINDMGINYTNDEMHNEIQCSYRFFDPFWKLLRLNLNMSLWQSERISTGMPTGSGISASASTTTVKHLSLWTTIAGYFKETYDYYEPRTQGYFYIIPKGHSYYAGFSSDYRKPFALDGTFNLSFRPEIDNAYYSLSLTPIIRVNNHFQFNVSGFISKSDNSRGFAGRDSTGIPVYGQRDVRTHENSFSGTYIFRNNLSLSLRLRHYLASGEYESFYLLGLTGDLSEAPSEISFSDFTFNSFLLDLVFNWEFAPGSNLTLVWKNNITDETDNAEQNYGESLSHIFSEPQSNLFSLKFIYYLDYHSLRTGWKKA